MNISVAGVAEKNGKVLIALRNPGTSIGERWEFPGGKLEAGETPEDALIREYNEELSVDINVGGKICEGVFLNGSKKYRLMAYSIDLYNENFVKTEHQQVRWTSVEDLRSYDFPESDMIIVDYLLSR